MTEMKQAVLQKSVLLSKANKVARHHKITPSINLYITYHMSMVCLV